MSAKSPTPRPVVAAAIVDSLPQPTKLLAAQRSYPPHLAGLYELPGGKVDEGEAPLRALLREIREELGIEISVGPPLPGPASNPDQQDPGFTPWPILDGRVMWVWFAAIAPGQLPRMNGSHSALTWVTPGQALALPWLPTNLPIVESCLRLMDAGSLCQGRIQVATATNRE